MLDINAVTICEDLLHCYSDEQERALALEVAEALCTLSTKKTVVRVGFIARLRHSEGGLADDVQELLTDDEKALLTDLDAIKIIDVLHENPQQNIERLRQMLLAMANDIRVIVIKLALQLVAMRHLALYDDSKATRLALQTRDIFAPLANRLGIAKFKWELEDLALRRLEPTTYRLIALSLAEQRKEREQYVQEVVGTLKDTMIAEGIEAPQVYGRAKHINSIFNKMKKKNKRLEEIYDLLAIRIQVKTLKDCYTALGIVHSKWRHIPSEFDDYIANPKPNGYQSLHTAVIGPEGKTVEVQIRTDEMHDYAELGVAAHWRYKENSTGQVTAFERQINWLRALLNEDDEAIADEFTAEITEDRVYAITPQGQVIDLPNGSTPLDFAYYIHTGLGHRTRGARVNGHLVPITYHIKTGDTIEILTNKKPNPSRDWLNPHEGYLQSSKARSKVRHFFKQLEREKAIEEGELLLQKKVKDIKLTEKKLNATAKKFNFKDTDELFAALGFGDVSIVTVSNFVQEKYRKKKESLENIAVRLSRIPIKKTVNKGSSVIIEGIDDLLISMASCCSPMPPDTITGFITKTKGVSIHRSDCSNVLALAEQDPDKIMNVNWSMENNGFTTSIYIRGSDRMGIIRDVSQTLMNEGVTIQKADFGRDEDDNFTLQLKITIRDTDHLAHCFKKLHKLKGIASANRVEMLG